jgi:putative SOS response-associated peptidase YedK
MYDPEELKDMLGLADVPAGLVPNENISPGQGVGVITNAMDRKIEVFRWGLVPSWAKDPSIGYRMFNARAETLSEKPSFRNAFARRRCLIPAGGFYEWREEEGRKQPYLFQLQNRKAFTFAGLWEYWQDDQGSEILSCTIITTTPNDLLASYHDRMPVILDADHCWSWLEERPSRNCRVCWRHNPAEKMAQPQRIDPLAFRKATIKKIPEV